MPVSPKPPATSSISGKPDARRYRDYVVRTFNDDLPYDRFVREQIVLDKTFLGLTVACARCHEHKFNPGPDDCCTFLPFGASIRCWPTSRIDSLRFERMCFDPVKQQVEEVKCFPNNHLQTDLKSHGGPPAT